MQTPLVGTLCMPVSVNVLSRIVALNPRENSGMYVVLPSGNLTNTHV